MKIGSDFAILDVKRGRRRLQRHFKHRPIGSCPRKMLIPVVIHGFIESQWGGDDGVSTEFGVTVKKVEILA